MISIEKVNKYFNKGKRNEIHVINDTSLNFDSTGLIALLGPSGSGKTTLLNAIGGLDRIDNGAIYVDGQKITARSAATVDAIRNLNIGYIFQDYKLVENMSVYDNVAMVLRMVGIKDEEEIQKRVYYVLETLGIYRYRNRLASMLSGGERQRVGIARAIVKDPKIIIADEPTGNLDSANTIAIMNIIKSISRNRLVILVTHETELAHFYASRIIELKDGSIVKDYENVTEGNLDYRMDNKIYLKDFATQSQVSGDNVTVNFYGGEGEKLNIDVVLRNGNLYIRTNSGERVEVIDSNSAIELVNDNYREIDKSTYEDYSFDFHKVISKDYREKYSSVFGFFKSVIRGFRKLGDYTKIKKLLLVGFVAAGLFITYAYSSIWATQAINEDEFITTNRDYIRVEIPRIDVERFQNIRSMPGVDYVLPGLGEIGLNYSLDKYYQTRFNTVRIVGTVTLNDRLTSDMLIAGRMPESRHEIVVDVLSLDRVIETNHMNQVGITDSLQFLNEKVTVSPNLEDFTIVGIAGRREPVIYFDKEVVTDVIYFGEEGNDYWDYGYVEYENSDKFLDYSECKHAYKLKKGKLPENDYEVMIPYSMRYEYKLNKTMDRKVNDVKLKVVGYYTSDDTSSYFVSKNTIEYELITALSSFAVCPNDMSMAISSLSEDDLRAVSAYDADLGEYQADRADSVKSSIITALIILAISLIEILLMTRSSFLSRIKEVGVYRAIGVKKGDIYKMFLGEIIAITTVSSLLGIIIMSYVLEHLQEIKYLSTQFVMNPVVFLVSIATVYVFNCIVGLIPVMVTMTKTPAAILSRYDVD